MITKKMRMGGKMRSVEFYPTIEKCDGCDNAGEVEGANYCAVYAKPEFMWKDDNCLNATHVKVEIVSAAEQKVNPLKASKRASRGG